MMKKLIVGGGHVSFTQKLNLSYEYNTLLRIYPFNV